MLSRLHAVLTRAGAKQACRMLPDIDASLWTCVRQLSGGEAAVAQPQDAPQPASSHASDRPDSADGSQVKQTDSKPQHSGKRRKHLSQPASQQGLPDPLMTFRRSNNSMPYLEGQMVKARVIAVDHKTVTLDPGYKFTQNFFKRELAGVPIFGEDGERLGIPEEYQVGDILHVKIEALETPFGDMQLSLGGKLTEAEQMDVVLARMKEALENGTAVMGRILNPVNRGYAVGVAGLVAFLPITQCMYQTAARVGVLQPFRVQSVNEETRNVVVYDAAKVAPSMPPGGSFRGGSGMQARPFRPRKPLAPRPPPSSDADSK